MIVSLPSRPSLVLLAGGVAAGILATLGGSPSRAAVPRPGLGESHPAFTQADRSPDVRADPEGNFVFRNRSLVAVLRKTADGYGPLVFYPTTRPTRPGSGPVAVAEQIADVAWTVGGTAKSGHFRPRFARTFGGTRLELTGDVEGADGALTVAAALTIGQEPWISWEVTVVPNAAVGLAALKGIPLRIPTDGAVDVLFPGIAEHHGEAAALGSFRLVPDSYAVSTPAIGITQGDTTVALLWDNQQRWGGTGHPGALLAGLGDGFRAEVQVPGLKPFDRPGQEPPADAIPLLAKQRIVLQGKVAVIPEQPDVSDTVREWLRAYGTPEVPGIPRRSDQERALLRKAYTETLWHPKVAGWSRIGGEPENQARPYADATLALLMEAGRGRSDKERAALLGQADTALEALRQQAPLPPSLAYRSSGVLESLDRDRDRVSKLLFEQNAVGSWEPQPGRPDTAGNVTVHALPLLRYAALTGDSEAAAGGLKALDYLERTFRFPAGPTGDTAMLHVITEATEANLLGYQISGEQRWIKLARYWADLGLAYIYFWGETARPATAFLSVPSITALTAQPLQPPHLRMPAQADGLAYAFTLRQLSRVRPDTLYDRVATGILASAEHQQVLSGEHAGLLPTGWKVREAKGHGWDAAPDGIYRLLAWIDEYDMDVSHARLRVGPDRLTVATGAKIIDADTTAMRVRMRLRWVESAETYTTIFGVRSRPLSVEYNTNSLGAWGVPVKRSFLNETEHPEQIGWWYDEVNQLLMLRLRHHGDDDTLEIRWPDSKDRYPVDRVDTKVYPRK